MKGPMNGVQPCWEDWSMPETYMLLMLPITTNVVSIFALVKMFHVSTTVIIKQRNKNKPEDHKVSQGLMHF
jgi:hypothetical protein